eukprot:scaffold747_cov120-Cylindrotheca_fusiformis.AAC.12
MIATSRIVTAPTTLYLKESNLTEERAHTCVIMFLTFFPISAHSRTDFGNYSSADIYEKIYGAWVTLRLAPRAPTL